MESDSTRPEPSLLAAIRRASETFRTEVRPEVLALHRQNQALERRRAARLEGEAATETGIER